MTPTDYLIDALLGLGLFVVGHRCYFWCQRYPRLPPRVFRLAIDERIPFRPRWVWVYSICYYPALIAVLTVVGSQREFVAVACSYVLLLTMQVACFVAFPVATPREWRRRNPRRTRSEKLLALVQKLDMRSNSFPSMHTSVATLTALHLYPALGALALAFPVLIGLSCVYTKQHYVIDIPAGIGLGFVAFNFSQRLL